MPESTTQPPELGTLADYLACWTAGLSYRDIPQSVCKESKKALLDTVAVGIAGANTPVAKVARRLAVDFCQNPQPEQCTLFNGPRASFKVAAYSNAVSAHALDMDDTCFAGIVHASVLLVPTLLALAEAGNHCAEELLVAFVAGSEITYALGAAVGPALYDGNWWPTGLLTTIGTAAALARLKGCDKRIITRAIAFATANASPFRCMTGTDCKPLMIGEAFKRSVDALDIAQTDATIPLDVFGRKESPFSLTVAGRFDLNMIEQLGHSWRLLEPGLVVKFFPLCSCAQQAVEALIQIISDTGLDSQSVKSVTVETTSMVVNTLEFDRPEDINQAMFSLTYPLACVLEDKTVTAVHMSPKSLARADIHSAMRKINYTPADEQFDLIRYPEAAKVMVYTHDGQVFTKTKLYPNGDPRCVENPQLFKQKIAACTGSQKQADKLFEKFGSMERFSDISELTALYTE